ncbi:MAG: hypothetical protein IV093_05415 [Rubrivivax sp.]|nr:hypothetical protein [Rubrivivax sp.]
MPYTTVVCLDDLTRLKFWPAKEFMYDLIRLPAWYAANQDIACSPRNGQRSNLLPGFDHRQFLALCGQDVEEPDWPALYHAVPEAAAAYLAAHIPAGALVISYEMTPWLRAVIHRAGNDWLDLRLSPLRFASDLYLAVRASSPALYAALKKHAQSAQAIHYEAMLLTAQIRHRRRYDEQNLALDGAVVYIGQTEADAAIVNAHGRYARISDFKAQFLNAVGRAKVWYRAHPDGGAFADREQQTLDRFLGQPTQRCDDETYDLMAGDANVKLIGLSSGALQEAQWFGREAISLMEPVCKPTFEDGFDPEGYLHIASHDFISEPLWADLLGALPRAGAVCMPPRHNMLRELHNAWWGYSSSQIRHAHFYRQVMDIHGGAMRDQQKETKQQLEQAQREIVQLRDQLRQVQGALLTLARDRSTV